MPVGIEAIGTYVPPGRMALQELRRNWPGVGTPSGLQTVSVAGFDEDVITMGVEAAESALAGIQGTATSVDLLVTATCSSPYAEHSAAAEIGRALGLSLTAALIDVAGSTLGGINAMQIACDAIHVGRAKRALVIASERRRGTPGSALEALGAGAIALVISGEGAATIGNFANYRHGVPTRWRPDGIVTLRNYEDARYELVAQTKPAVEGLLSTLASDALEAIAIGPLDVRSRVTLLRSLDVERLDGAFDFSTTGELGSADPLFDLAGQINAKPNSTIACVGLEPGSGAAGFNVTSALIPVKHRCITPTSISYVEFLQRFGAIESPALPPPIVPYAASPGAGRDDMEGGLIGGRCQKCGSLNVPPRRICIDCNGANFVHERVARRGFVITFNVQHVVAVSPEPAPLAVGVVRLVGESSQRGGQISAMFCDSDLSALHVGQPVEIVHRRIGADDGLVKYGWKIRAVQNELTQLENEVSL